jgi:tetratricopeptide (TPR) repeat protein
MFAHLFATMNDKLDEIKKLYPRVTGAKRDHLNKQLDVLKAMSDSIVEHWLLFEEKLADFYDDLNMQPAESVAKQKKPSVAGAAVAASKELQAAQAEHAAAKQAAAPSGAAKEQEEWSFPSETAVFISKGQGYFKLHMFGHAADELNKAICLSPDCQLARLFMAMTLMHMQRWVDAEQHFQILISLTDHAKWRAIGYNALGCIQAVHMNLELAEYYFLKAHEADPSFADSMINLKCCKERNGSLSLRFGSAELIR